MSVANTFITAGAADDMAAVATGHAAVCDVIQEHRKSGTPICTRRAAAISAMIDDLATAAAAEGTPTTTGGTKRRRMHGVRSYEYEIEDDGELGVGASGVVVMARHRATGDAVAVKSLHQERGSGLGRLLREAAFMAGCGVHPSLVELLDVLRARGLPFPEADARGAMRQVLAGAAAMHRNGIVHRDIKSENILVAAGGAAAVVKICDFGSAKCTAERDPPGRIAGTVEYMAPEVLVKNAGHGAAADAWSLGCVMAELLTGELLFRGEDERDQLHEIFDVLGVPDERAWQALGPRVVQLAGEVRQWRARQRQLQHRNRLHDLIPGKVLSDDGFEVLEGLLTCDPSKRLTAAAALRCRWFDEKVEEEARVCVSAANDVSMLDATAKRLGVDYCALHLKTVCLLWHYLSECHLKTSMYSLDLLDIASSNLFS